MASKSELIKAIDRMEKAFVGLTEQIRRYNDANEPVTITGEAEFGKARYDETEEQRERREELETALEAPRAVRRPPLRPDSSRT